MWPFTSSSPTPATEQAPPPASACPVDHETRAAWSKHSSNPVPHDVAHKDPLASRLSTEREVSSIPRWLPTSAEATSSPSSTSASATADAPPAACPMHESNVNASANSAEQAATIPSESNWVYPSPASFYTALERKNRNPRAQDMDIVVPIHNAVNERVWHQVLEWERAAMGLEPGQETGSRLVSFVGKPKQMSPRARWKSLIGYTEPFDRHDWIVDRPLHPPSAPSPSSLAPNTTLSSSPSTPSPTANNPSLESSDNPESIRIRYVIDFYTGRGKNLLLPPPPSSSSSSSSAAKPPAPEEVMVPNLAFFIDCRPALDGWEGLRMRFNKYWGLDHSNAANTSSGGPAARIA